MKPSRKILFSVLLPLLLFAWLWVNLTLVCYTHTHFDENGRLVVHAHPFQNNKSTTDADKHEHSRGELEFFTALYQILSLFLVFSTVLSAALSFDSITKKFNRPLLPLFVDFIHAPRRAPPLALHLV